MGEFSSDLHKKVWFHGHLTKEEATRLLMLEPPNTFIIRLKSSSRGGLAVSYKSNRNIQHHIIQRDKSGYSILNFEGYYENLDDLVGKQEFLKLPYPVQWIKHSWFLGNASRAEATCLLQNTQHGTYSIFLNPPPLAGSLTAMTLSGSRDTNYISGSSKDLQLTLCLKDGDDVTFKTLISENSTSYFFSGKQFSSLEQVMSTMSQQFISGFEPQKQSTRGELQNSFGTLSESVSSSSMSLSSSVIITRKRHSKDFDSGNVSDEERAKPSILYEDSSEESSSEDLAPRGRWSPLTQNQINPMNLTYNDIWIELAKTYRIPIQNFASSP